MGDRYRHLRTMLADRPGRLLVAVSGGLDSLTLMAVAARVRSGPTLAVHAVSAAVPPEATDRVRALAAARGWVLREVTPGELADPDYRSNPLNRCYFCKRSLFAAMRRTLDAERTAGARDEAVLCTGTNRDDLGDFRPGLVAARESGVWQPYVEAGIDKAAIRAIARDEGLPEVAALPAQPCLASRIETGIGIDADDLAFVNRVEGLLAARFGPGDHRCRITRRGVVVQLPPGIAPLADPDAKDGLARDLADVCAAAGYRLAGVEAYRRGSAFRHFPA
ncbi:MAG: adenine nucleotide alpha hydrolase [Inquilinaceae bacterium]